MAIRGPFHHLVQYADLISLECVFYLDAHNRTTVGISILMLCYGIASKKDRNFFYAASGPGMKYRILRDGIVAIRVSTERGSTRLAKDVVHLRVRNS